MAITTKLTRLFARAPCGRRAGGKVPGSWRTLSTISAMRSASFEAGEPFASATLPGAFNKESFRLWVRNVLCPRLRPGEVVVLDNCRIHHQPAVRQAVRSAGCQVRYLPSYSPDLNPIEKLWSKVKATMRGAAARSIEELRAILPSAFAAVTASEIAGWINHSYARIIP